MKRKRFVKKIMAYGHQRNSANRIAANCIDAYGSYDGAFKDPSFRVSISLSVLGVATKKLIKSLGAMQKVINHASDNQ